MSRFHFGKIFPITAQQFASAMGILHMHIVILQQARYSKPREFSELYVFLLAQGLLVHFFSLRYCFL